MTTHSRNSRRADGGHTAGFPVWRMRVPLGAAPGLLLVVMAVAIATLLLLLPNAADAKARHSRKAPLPAAEFSADILAEGGTRIGTAHLRQGPSGVLIGLRFEAGALPAGWHGVHFHEKAECADSGFKLSGSHVGHDGKPGRHGLLNPAGPETGDLPNIEAPGSGTFGAELFSTFIVLGARPIDGRAALLDADGSALVIHAARDDHVSQPIGNAGARIACALIRAVPAVVTP